MENTDPREPQPLRRGFKEVVESAVEVVSRDFRVAPNPQQMVAIEAQVRRYWFDDVPAAGLDGYTVQDVGAWLDEPSYPEGSVAVQFRYIEEGEAGIAVRVPGLEVTVFGPNGEVLDSQDFG